MTVASTAVSRASMQVAKTADSMVEQRAETKDTKTAEHLGALTDVRRAAQTVDEKDATTAALKVGQ